MCRTITNHLVSQYMIEALTISTAAGLLVPAAVGAAALLAAPKRNRTGLVFHAISNEKQPGFSYTSPGVFEQLCTLIADRSLRTTTVSTRSETSLCMTFDDGFEDFYLIALPMLEKYGIKASVFAVAGFTGGRTRNDVWKPRRHLTVAQLREVAGLGHEIGSHTLSHADLTLLDNKDLSTELDDSKKQLEDILGKTVAALSFPYGSWNLRVWETAQRSGYTTATAARYPSGQTNGVLPVLGAYSFDTPDDLLIKLTGAHSIAHARATIMAQFARGTGLWKWRREYRIFGPGF